MALYDSAARLICETPILRLRRFEDAYACRGEIYAKCEFLNPTGSIKDRPVLEMLRRAAADGLLAEGGTAVMISGGAGGVSAAMICAALGLNCVVVSTDSLSLDDLRHIRAFGATVTMTPARSGLAGMKNRAAEVAGRTPGAAILDIFSDPANPSAHRLSTGPEILRDLPDPDYFVAGIGTGGCVTGCGEYIKMHRPDCVIVGVEPHDSPVVSGGMPGPHTLTGIGPGFVPDALNKYILDKVVRVRTPDALAAARQLALSEGLLCGPSSGAVLAASVFLAQQPQDAPRKIIAVLPDRGEKYLNRETYGGKGR